MTATAISALKARRVWDSRGRPTLEVEMQLASGATGRAIAPAGASMGSGEAVDLRDGGSPFGGLGVARAVANVADEIAPALIGMDASDQAALDAVLIALDGTPNKARLGGNAIVATSMAAIHATAAARREPLWRYLSDGREVRIPVPEIQIFGGGAHAARRVDVQDFMVICPTASSFAEALDRTAEVYRAAGQLLGERGLLQGVADEGGFWPAFASNEEALDMLVRAIERAGYTPGDEVSISLDIAASEFGAGGVYKLARDGRELDTAGMIDMLAGWIRRYPIVSIEDPLAEDDRAGLSCVHGRRGRARAGDRRRLPRHQCGACAQGRSGARMHGGAREAQSGRHDHADQGRARCRQGRRVRHHRLGPFRRDRGRHHLPSRGGLDAGQFKVGSITRGERTAKWNEMLRIEEALGSKARFAGPDAIAYNR